MEKGENDHLVKFYFYMDNLTYYAIIFQFMFSYSNLLLMMTVDGS